MIHESVLAATCFGAGLAPGTRAAVAACGFQAAYPAGAVLVRAGEHVGFLGVVVDGTIGLHTEVPGRGAHRVLTVGSGDIVGWSALVAPFTAVNTATALTRVDLIAVDAERLRRRIEHDPAAAADLYDCVLGALDRRLDATRHSGVGGHVEGPATAVGADYGTAARRLHGEPVRPGASPGLSRTRVGRHARR